MNKFIFSKISGKKKILSSPEVIDSLMMEIPVVPVNYYVGGIQCQVVSKYFAVLNFCFLRLNWGGGEGIMVFSELLWSSYIRP